MGRKTKKQKALELLQSLKDDDLKDILLSFDLGSKTNTYKDVEAALRKECPDCHSTDFIRKGKNGNGLQFFKCKQCGRRYTVLSETPLDKSPYDCTVWVNVLQMMLRRQSIKSTTAWLIANNVVDSIDELTVSAMMNKLRNCFINMPLPKLSGNIQVDEKHFRESQKGVKNPVDTLDPKGIKRRKGRKRTTPSKWGTMMPEFSTICCAVDGSGHSIAKVLTLGKMELEMFEDEITPHFKDVAYLCSDMNTLYTQWASIHKVNQYVCNSNYHKEMKNCKTKAQKVAAYEQNKLDYVVGAGIMSYDQMVKFKKANHLTINGVNGYHSELERYINHIAKGVSTKHLQAWVSFFNYCWNWRADNGQPPLSYTDAEKILLEIVKLRIHIKIDDIKYQKVTTKNVKPRYSKKFIAMTVAARIKSNNPYIKFTEEDGVWVVNKKKSLDLLPEYKRRLLAKTLGIRPFSPTSISSKDLKNKLLAHPNLEDALYVLANGDPFK